MFGDTPPAIVAIDGSLVRHAGLVGYIEGKLARQPMWILVQDPDNLRRRFAQQGLGTSGPGLSILDGGLQEAVAVAAERGTNVVRIWVGQQGDLDELPLPVRVAAHDAGIRLVIEAPLLEGA